MPLLPAYKNPKTRQALLDVLRRGGSRQAACDAAEVKRGSFLRWVDNDEAFEQEVRKAEAEAIATGAAREALAVKSHPKDAKTGADRWQKLREEAGKLAPGITGILLYVDGILASKGQPPMSAWWRETLTAFYASGKRWCLLLVGRGGGKSTTLERCAIVEAIFAERSVPPGQTWVWPFLSVLKSDARRRLDEIEALLSAIGVEHKRSTVEGIPTIELEDASGNAVALVSIAATIAGMSGPSTIGVTCDEEEKWRDDNTGANPAAEVLKSIRQTFRTRPNIRGYRCSSKWTDDNPHHKAVKEGDTPGHFVARLGASGLAAALAGLALAASLEDDIGNPDGAEKIRKHAATLTESDPRIPSFVANPTHDIAVGRTEEPDVDAWLREVCSAGEGGIEGDALNGDALTRATTIVHAKGRGQRFAGIDTGETKNPSALAIVERIETGDGYQWRPVLLREWRPKKGGGPLDLRGKVLPEMCALMKEFECEPFWFSDGWAGGAQQIVAAENRMEVRFVSTSTAFRDVYQPINTALLLTGGPVVALSGCEGIEAAVAQMRAVRRSGEHSVVVPRVGTDHGELGQVLCRALAAAGIAELAGAEPTGESGFGFYDGKYSAHRRGLASR
jgi:hypothetical protein